MLDPVTLRLAIPLFTAATALWGVDGNSMNCPEGPDVSTWTIPVRVVTSKLALIGGLQASDFRVTLNREAQQICGFRASRMPVSVGVLLDVSGSMQGEQLRIAPMVKEGALEFLRVSGPQDEYFLEWIGETPTVRAGFTRNIEELRAALDVAPKGRTALLDGIALAVQQMQKARYPTRVLVIFSDGEDNRSAHKFSDVRTNVLGASIPLFLLAPSEPKRRGIVGRRLGASDEQDARALLFDLASQSGGYAIEISDGQLMTAVAHETATAIRTLYNLSFTAPQTMAAKTEIRIDVPTRQPRPIVLYRRPQKARKK